jgi:hypothetical protein
MMLLLVLVVVLLPWLLLLLVMVLMKAGSSRSRLLETDAGAAAASPERRAGQRSPVVTDPAGARCGRGSSGRWEGRRHGGRALVGAGFGLLGMAIKGRTPRVASTRGGERLFQPIQRHVCLAGADLVACQTEAEAEDLCFLFG